MFHYLKLWLACVRYSVVRTLLFRFDFVLWSLVELFWMAVNVLLVGVIYEHTDAIAGWTKYEMLLLVGTSMLIQRLLMGFFWSNLFEFGRNIRTGQFDFFLAQPGHPLFMISTRKIDLDGLANLFVAAAVVWCATHQLGIELTAGSVALYAFYVLCGLVVHYAALLGVASLTFWMIGSQGVEGSYFTLFEFSRLPRSAFRGVASVIFVYLLPAVVVSNVPADALLHGFNLHHALWLGGIAAGWLVAAVALFHAGLRRYSSASS